MATCDQTVDFSEVKYEQMTSQYFGQAAQLCLDQGWNVDSKIVREYFENFQSGSLVALCDQQLVGKACAVVLSCFERHPYIVKENVVEAECHSKQVCFHR